MGQGLFKINHYNAIMNQLTYKAFIMAHNTQTSGLKSKDAQFDEQFQLWSEVRATIKGKYEVLKLITCLPQPQYKTYNLAGLSKAQLTQANACNQATTLRIASYWSRGDYTNFTGRTHESLGGMIYSNEPDVKLAPKLEYLEENADGAGSGLREVVQTMVDDVIAIGRYGILVDMPSQKVDEKGNAIKPTQAEMEMSENAPRWIPFKAEQIFYARIAGSSHSIDEIRMTEIKSEKKDGSDFDWEDKIFIRRLVMLKGIYHNELYNDKDELVSSVAPKANGKHWNEIPFVFFGADVNNSEYGKIPLYDIAGTNLKHFVQDCDNADNLHIHSQAVTVLSSSLDGEAFAERNPNGWQVGATSFNLIEQGDKAELLQLDATGAISENMKEKEGRIIMMGAQLVTDINSNQTLGAKKIESNTSMSTLKRVSYNCSKGVEQLQKWTAQMLGETGESTYRLNTEFVTDELTPELITKHMELVQGAVLPKSTLYETARKAGFTELDDKTLKAEAEKDSAEMVGMGQDAAAAQAAKEASEAE